MKKTAFMKVIGRRDYTVIPAFEFIKDPSDPKKHIRKELTILDFTK
jgi:hypothetical protein